MEVLPRRGGVTGENVTAVGLGLLSSNVIRNRALLLAFPHLGLVWSSLLKRGYWKLFGEVTFIWNATRALLHCFIGPSEVSHLLPRVNLKVGVAPLNTIQNRSQRLHHPVVDFFFRLYLSATFEQDRTLMQRNLGS